QHFEIRVAGHVGADVLIVDHEHVVAGDARDVRGDGDAGGAIFAARAGRIADGGLGDFALDRDVDLTIGPREALDEQLAHADQVVERSVGSAIEIRGNGG